MKNSPRFSAQVAELVSAAEHDRRGDVTLRDQAVRDTLTPAQARQFWARLERGEPADRAAAAALSSSPYPPVRCGSTGSTPNGVLVAVHAAFSAAGL